MTVKQEPSKSFPLSKSTFRQAPVSAGLRVLARLFWFVLRHDLDRLHFFVRTPSVFGPGGRVKIGKCVNLDNAFFNTVHGTVEIRDYTFFGQNCMVLAGGHDYRSFDGARQWSAPPDSQDIVIGRGVWIGSGAIVLGGVEICDHSVVAAGAVVTRSCKVPGIYAGIPARLIKEIVPPQPTAAVARG